MNNKEINIENLAELKKSLQDFEIVLSYIEKLRIRFQTRIKLMRSSLDTFPKLKFFFHLKLKIDCAKI
jgi:hypothetical protein